MENYEDQKSKKTLHKLEDIFFKEKIEGLMPFHKRI